MASQVGREWRCSMRKFRRVMQQGNKPAETVAPEAGALLPKGRGTEEEARTCLACGRELVGKRPQAKFCGEDCRKKHHRQKKREDETVPDAEDDPRISLSKLLSQTPPAALSGRRLAAWRKLVELGDDNLPIHHQTEEGRRYRAAELAKRPNAELAAIARDITWGMCCKKPYRLATFPGLAVLDGNLLAVILDLGGGESVPLPVWPINNGAILDDHARLGALVTVVGDILRGLKHSQYPMRRYCIPPLNPGRRVASSSTQS